MSERVMCEAAVVSEAVRRAEMAFSNELGEGDAMLSAQVRLTRVKNGKCSKTHQLAPIPPPFPMDSPTHYEEGSNATAELVARDASQAATATTATHEGIAPLVFALSHGPGDLLQLEPIFALHCGRDEGTSADSDEEPALGEGETHARRARR